MNTWKKKQVEQLPKKQNMVPPCALEMQRFWAFSTDSRDLWTILQI